MEPDGLPEGQEALLLLRVPVDAAWGEGREGEAPRLPARLVWQWSDDASITRSVQFGRWNGFDQQQTACKVVQVAEKLLVDHDGKHGRHAAFLAMPPSWSPTLIRLDPACWGGRTLVAAQWGGHPRKRKWQWLGCPSRVSG